MSFFVLPFYQILKYFLLMLYSTFICFFPIHVLPFANNFLHCTDLLTALLLTNVSCAVNLSTHFKIIFVIIMNHQLIHLAASLISKQ